MLFLKIPIPGPVLGMILLFLTLGIKEHLIVSTDRIVSSLENASSALLSHLSLLFVPAGVGMMVHFELIAREWLSISIALLLSTIITLLATAIIMTVSVNFLSRRVIKDD